jgi:hypothetical protein
MEQLANLTVRHSVPAAYLYREFAAAGARPRLFCPAALSARCSSSSSDDSHLRAHYDNQTFAPKNSCGLFSSSSQHVCFFWVSNSISIGVALQLVLRRKSRMN